MKNTTQRVSGSRSFGQTCFLLPHADTETSMLYHVGLEFIYLLVYVAVAWSKDLASRHRRVFHPLSLTVSGINHSIIGIVVKGAKRDTLLVFVVVRGNACVQENSLSCVCYILLYSCINRTPGGFAQFSRTTPTARS